MTAISEGWYLVRDGGYAGPLRRRELLEHAPGTHPDDLVWHPFLGQWTPPQQVPPLATGERELATAAAAASSAPAATPPRRGRRLLLIAALGGVPALLVAMVVGLAAGLEGVVRYVGALSLVLLVGGSALTAVQFRRWKALSPRSLLLAALLPVAVTGLQLLLAVDGRGVALLVGLPVGVVAGLVWGWFTNLERTPLGVQMAGNISGFLIWAGLLTLVQGFRLFGGGEPVLLLVLLTLQSAAFASAKLMVLLRSRSLAVPLPGSPAGVAAAVLLIGLVLAAPLAVVDPAAAQNGREACPDGYADVGVGTFEGRAFVPGQEYSLDAPVLLEVAPDGAAEIDLSGSGTDTVAGVAVEWTSSGGASGEVGDDGVLRAEGEADITTVTAGITQNAGGAVVFELTFDGTSWSGTTTGQDGGAQVETSLRSRPEPADPDDPCGPVVDSPLLAEQEAQPEDEPSPAPEEDPQRQELEDDPAVPGEEDAAEDGAPSEAAPGEEPDPGAPADGEEAMGGFGGPGAVDGSVEDGLDMDPAAVDAAAQALGLDATTAAALGAALAAGLAGLANLLLPALQGAGTAALGGAAGAAGAGSAASIGAAGADGVAVQEDAAPQVPADPETGERMTHTDGREYVWHLPVDDDATEPFWVPVDHYEEEQRLQEDGRVYEDGQWHADAQAARDERARRERWDREAAEGSILSRGREQLDRPDQNVVVPPPPTAPPPVPPPPSGPGWSGPGGSAPGTDGPLAPQADQPPVPQPDEDVADDDRARVPETDVEQPEEGTDGAPDDEPGEDLDPDVEVEEEPELPVEVPEGLDARQRERYVAYVTGQRGDLAGMELTDQQRELADAARDAAVAAQTDAINDRFADLIEQRHREGYYVRNSTLPRKGWNNTIGRVDDYNSRLEAQQQHDAIERVRNDAELQGKTLTDEEVYRQASQLLSLLGPTSWASPETLAEVDASGFQGWQGGQCGDYAELGQQWVGELVAEIAGPDAIVNTIALERNQFANHVGVRVILPSGERLVLDVWEGLRDAAGGEVRPSISTEAEWLDRWTRELRGYFPGDGDIRLVDFGYNDTFARLEDDYRSMYTDDTLLELQRRAFEAHRSGEAVDGTMGDAIRAELIERGAPTDHLEDERPVREVAADSFARYGTTEQHLQQRLTIIDRVDAILAEGTIDRMVADTGMDPDLSGDRTITHLLTDYLDQAPDPDEAEARHLAVLAWLQDR